jgi:hypothetical protein
MTANLPDFVPESLRAQARAVSLKRKQSLFRFDDAVQSLFFVRQGEMEAVRYSPDGEAMVMMRAGGGSGRRHADTHGGVVRRFPAAPHTDCNHGAEDTAPVRYGLQRPIKESPAPPLHSVERGDSLVDADFSL